MEEKLKQIIEHYEIEHQLKYIHSEYFELDEAILDYENSGWYFSDESCRNIEREYINHIAEELADVEMMLDQFKVYYDINQEKINEIKFYKANRQLKRIEEEKNGRNLGNN